MVDTPTRRSFRALYFVMAIMTVLLVGQLYNVQIIQGSHWTDQAKDNRQREIVTKASRGVIYDRTGQRLVVNNPSYSIQVMPDALDDLNCATGNLEGTDVLQRLPGILNEQAAKSEPAVAQQVAVNDVIVLRPADLDPAKLVETANRLSVPLQVNKQVILDTMQRVMTDTPTSQNLFVIRRDVPPSVSKTLRDLYVSPPGAGQTPTKPTATPDTSLTPEAPALLDRLPGIRIYNELEFNFITRFDKCFKPVVVKRGLPYEAMVGVETHLSALPGVSIVTEPVRVYNQGAYFSHLLGYVGPISREAYEKDTADYEPDDKVGQTGLEASLEPQLRGEKGLAQVVVDSKERVVSEIASQAPITGNNVSLTIDAGLQISVTQILQKGLEQAKVKSGVAIVMRVDNGQVLSMVSLPSYDNNLFSTGISQADFDRLNLDATLPMFNRSTGGVFPPGSTYKMVTASAALQEGVVTPDSTYYCPGYIEVPYTWNERQRTRFRDWRAGGHGTINVVQALTVSSDVFFYIAAGPRQEDRKLKKDDGTEEITWTRYYTPGAPKPSDFNGLGIDKLHRYSSAFGFGAPTGVELPGEAAGLASDPAWKLKTFPDNPWSMGDTLVTAIGQGFELVTPLQLVNATAAVANGGTLYQPQLVLNVTDSAGKMVQDYQPKVIRQLPVSAENLAIVRQGMRQVVADKVKGTAATHFTLQSISVAGKTGTAEFGEPVAIKDGKEVRRAHAWFTAFAPYEKPEVAVVVLIEGGQESLEGSTFAVPVADEILKAYFHRDK